MCHTSHILAMHPILTGHVKFVVTRKFSGTGYLPLLFGCKKLTSITVNNESLLFDELPFKARQQKKVWQIYCAANIKIVNLHIKVW